MIAVSAARFDPAVEAAMLREYGVDVLDPSVTPRRLSALLRHMRPGALQMEGSDAAWSVEAHLLASVVDSVNVLTWVQVAQASKARPKRPRPVPRPGAASRPNRVPLAGLADRLATIEGVDVG